MTVDEKNCRQTFELGLMEGATGSAQSKQEEYRKSTVARVDDVAAMLTEMNYKKRTRRQGACV